MKKLLVVVFILTLSLSLVLTGCTMPEPVPVEEPADQPAVEEAMEDHTMEEPAGPVVFNWNIGADPKTIDPGMNGASEGGDVINQTNEGLVREKSGVVYPGIAETWDVSDNGLQVTFHLRESNWSNGEPLTANDFVYSWLRAMDPATASEYGWIWHYTNVVGAEDFNAGESAREDVGIRAIDDYTFQVDLIYPTDYFVSLMAFYHFMPVYQASVEAEGGEEGTWAADPDLAVSNGPFMLTNYKIGDGLVLEKNPEFWNASEVGIDIINGKFIDDNTTSLQAYNAGDIDFMKSAPPEEIPRLIAEDPNFYIFPLLGTYYYNFNMDKEIWQDVKVRKAFALAIDREAIVETAAAGYVPAAGFVPPGFLDHEGKDFFETAGTYGLATDDSKVAEAQALMAEAGYPNGEGFPEFELIYNTDDLHEGIASMVQEQLKVNLGVTCTLANQEWSVFQDTRTQGDYEMSRGGWLTDFMDPSGLLAIFKNLDVAYNDPNYYNADYEAAMEAATTTTDKTVHFEELYKAQDILMTDMPILPIMHYSDNVLASEVLVGWDRSVLGTFDFSSATIQK